MKKIIAKILSMVLLISMLVVPNNVMAAGETVEEMIEALVENIMELESKEQFVDLLVLYREVDDVDGLLTAYEQAFGGLAPGQQDRVSSLGVSIDLVSKIGIYALDEEFTVANLEDYLGLAADGVEKPDLLKTALMRRKTELMEALESYDIDVFRYAFTKLDKLFSFMRKARLLMTISPNFRFFTAEVRYGTLTLVEQSVENLITLGNDDLVNKIEDTSTVIAGMNDFAGYYNTTGSDDRVRIYDYLDGYNFILLEEPTTPTTGGGGGGGRPATTDLTDLDIVDEDIALALPGFLDLDGYDWAREAIELLFGYGIVTGRTEDEFDPAGEISRAEFAAMLTRMFEFVATDSDNAFEDVQESEWFYDELLAAAENEVIKGISATEFAPYEKIKRQEIATMLGRILELEGKVYPIESEVTALLDNFDDGNMVDSWAMNGTALSTQLGIITGYVDGEMTTFKPFNNATRAEVAVILYRLAGQVETKVVIPTVE